MSRSNGEQSMLLHRHLVRLGACLESVAFARGKTIVDAWSQCPNIRWYFWFFDRCTRLDCIDVEGLKSFAFYCGERTASTRRTIFGAVPSWYDDSKMTCATDLDRLKVLRSSMELSRKMLSNLPTIESRERIVHAAYCLHCYDVTVEMSYSLLNALFCHSSESLNLDEWNDRRNAANDAMRRAETTIENHHLDEFRLRVKPPIPYWEEWF